MTENETKQDVSTPSNESPLARLMGRTSMHIDMAACIRNLLIGAAIIIIALNGNSDFPIESIRAVIEATKSEN